MIEINYPDLYNLKWFKNCSIEEVCNKTFAYSDCGIRSIERTFRSRDFVNNSYEYRPNWTPLSPVAITNPIMHNL